ncbi:2,3-bisphosphoglycerate-independent phosphoglycerate mutase [Candidatus Woesearchaeota archaeon]|nr:2,3-bisphosphoglycerate-independent phosphoglycerate mutase [Candidatus Woesearchaeota archaeon]
MGPKSKVILVIRDGWGYNRRHSHNAIYEALTPNTDRLMKQYPNVLITANGEEVGLPKGYQGNSEVGHMTIGSGRVILQSMERINQSIKKGDFFNIPEFLEAIENCRKNNSKLHLMGLLQVEGVHAHIYHLFALLELCRKQNFRDVIVHVFTDGRDAPVTASIKHVKKLLRKLKAIGFGRIGILSGRYYAMDRDRRWDRTKKAFDCLVNGECQEEFDGIIEQLKKCHENDETDEFIMPRKQAGYEGVNKGDSIIFYNFRTDRTRQLTKAIVEEKFEGWERKALDVFYVAMTQYYAPMNARAAFKDQKFHNILGQVISDNGLKQLRISETEKYAHVTFFFNCQAEEPFKNEDRILINSPKVATYDLKPEMSVYEITDRLVSEIKKEKYDFIVTNLVNGDMVGHTGNADAVHKAVGAVDDCLGEITNKGIERGYTILVFADHGNAEDQTKAWGTSHTLNKVPFILVSGDADLRNARLEKNKGLKDIAPTVLRIMGIDKPEEMSGESLINR